MFPTRRICQSMVIAVSMVAIVVMNASSYITADSLVAHVRRHLLQDERGEGPVSAAIVVMIMAFLGVALWIAFKAIMHQATTTVANQVSQLGQ